MQQPSFFFFKILVGFFAGKQIRKLDLNVSDILKIQNIASDLRKKGVCVSVNGFLVILGRQMQLPVDRCMCST